MDTIACVRLETKTSTETRIQNRTRDMTVGIILT